MTSDGEVFGSMETSLFAVSEAIASFALRARKTCTTVEAVKSNASRAIIHRIGPRHGNMGFNMLSSMGATPLRHHRSLEKFRSEKRGHGERRQAVSPSR